GLTLRTIQIRDGVAEVRAGATLLYDSDPDAEEQETRLKASALLNAIKQPRDSATETVRAEGGANGPGVGKKILLVDYQDSFVHTLANYLRQTGAEVTTMRYGFSAEILREVSPDLMVLSPGPGRPVDFNISDTVQMGVDQEVPMFGVCLGLQGLVEHFGGRLGVLDYPMHGKPSEIKVTGGLMFGGLPSQFKVGRYHSLHALSARIPEDFEVTAVTDDDVVMAVEHTELPIWAVQFHPESILSLEGSVGLKLINNLMKMV
ncbi:MAG: gamma-glutamyl-gamma-aminobutyrate hydrolase family protein, partial [Pseudomonadota bacterium]